MATNTGPQGVQSDANTSGSSTISGVSIATNAKYRDVIVITKGKEGANGCNTGASDGKATRKRNNDEGESPQKEQNSKKQRETYKETRKTRKFEVISKKE